jgi:hypothetical protein
LDKRTAKKQKGGEGHARDKHARETEKEENVGKKDVFLWNGWIYVVLD